MKPACSVQGCNEPVRCRALCARHYDRKRKSGTLGLKPTPTLEERFWAKVQKGDDCWEWVGAKKPTGYGNFSLGGGKFALAHRFAYELLVGPIPDGHEVDHLCYNTSCVNPEHLEAVTPKVNTNRCRGNAWQLKKQQTHCKWGHEFTAENTSTDPRRPGTRQCRTCNREYRRRKKAESLGLAS